MKANNYFSLKFKDNFLLFLNQTRLPIYEEYVKTDSSERIAEAIISLEIRGAPAIGIAAAYALSFAVKRVNDVNRFYQVYELLKATRPTAINLHHMLYRIKVAYEKNISNPKVYYILSKIAQEIHREDTEKCDRIADNGLSLFTKKSRVLTHCNTGKLATGGNGTAFAIIERGFENGLVEIVYTDETRPLFQGMRLTAFELNNLGIPFKVIVDSAAGYLMQKQLIDFIIIGADRITSKGDVANKIGSYSLAVLAKYHNIPFYVAAPTTTFDYQIESFRDIPIEERDRKELFCLNNAPLSLEKYEYYNPAFDTVPAELITAIITEKGVINPYKLFHDSNENDI